MSALIGSQVSEVFACSDTITCLVNRSNCSCCKQWFASKLGFGGWSSNWVVWLCQFLTANFWPKNTAAFPLQWFGCEFLLRWARILLLQGTRSYGEMRSVFWGIYLIGFHWMLWSFLFSYSCWFFSSILTKYSCFVLYCGSTYFDDIFRILTVHKLNKCTLNFPLPVAIRVPIYR